MVRQTDVKNQKVCSWTGFNILTRNNECVAQDMIGYLPTINAPATEMCTVYEILNQVLKILKKLDLNEITCVFDQVLYAKAVEIIWKDTEKFHPIIPRMGVFHSICNMLAIIGKRFKDAGLKDLAVESGVIAEGSICGVLEGRKYNRAVRLHKLIYEALLRIAWKGFYSWMEEQYPAGLPKLRDVAIQSEKLHSNITQDQLNDFRSEESCVRILHLFNLYLDFLRNENGDLSTMWMSYIDMVDVVLGLIRASREGDWLLHLAMVKNMLPWTFAYDKQNYARYLSVYYTQMTR